MKWLKSIGFFLSILIFSSWICNAYIKVSSQPYIYRNVYFAPETQAVVIPGASVYRSGKLSPILEARVETGIEYLSLWDSLDIIFSGHTIPKGYNEPKAMAQYSIDKGVIETRILQDHEGHSTYATIFNCKYKYKYSDIAIISQEYHLPRALYLARKLGLNAIGIATTENEALPIKTPFREVTSRLKDFFLINALGLFR